MQHFADTERQDIAMHKRDIAVSPRELVAANVRRLMAVTPDLDTPAKLAKKCYWPHGNKKAGKRLGARTIRYLLDTRQTVPPPPAPSVDVLVAIARAFGRQPWELLADDEQTRRYLVTRLLNSDPLPDSQVPASFTAPKSRTR